MYHHLTREDVLQLVQEDIAYHHEQFAATRFEYYDDGPGETDEEREERCTKNEYHRRMTIALEVVLNVYREVSHPDDTHTQSCHADGVN